MHATFVNASDKQAVELEVKGDWLDRSATITDLKNGQVVAQISRKRFNMREILGGQQSVSWFSTRMITTVEPAEEDRCASACDLIKRIEAFQMNNLATLRRVVLSPLNRGLDSETPRLF
jgi:hypothetical protein